MVVTGKFSSPGILAPASLGSNCDPWTPWLLHNSVTYWGVLRPPWQSQQNTRVPIMPDSSKHHRVETEIESLSCTLFGKLAIWENQVLIPQTSVLHSSPAIRLYRECVCAHTAGEERRAVSHAKSSFCFSDQMVSHIYDICDVCACLVISSTDVETSFWKLNIVESLEHCKTHQRHCCCSPD